MPVLNNFDYTNIVLAISITLLTLIIAGFAWYHRRIPGAPYLCILSLIGNAWGVTYVAELLFKSSNMKLFFSDIRLIPASFVAPVFFLLTMVFTKHTRNIRKSAWLINVIPIISVFIIATNNFHHLIRKQEALIGATSEQMQPVQVVHGPWFWVIVGYSILLLLLSVGTLFFTYIRSPRLSRLRMGRLLISAIVLTTAAALSMYVWNNKTQVNLSLVALLVALIFLTYSLLSNRMLELIPLVGGTLQNQLDDAIITLNACGEIIDFNNTAAEIPELQLSDHIGEPFPDVLKSKTGYELLPNWQIDHSEEITMGEGDQTRTYDMLFSELTDEAKKKIGLLVILRDGTKRKLEEIACLQTAARYQAIFHNAYYGILLVDKEGKIHESNEPFANLSGYSSDQLKDLSMQELILDAPKLAPDLHGKSLPTREAELLHANGDHIPVEANVTLIADGESDLYFITLQDIRERKKVENTTQEALENVQSRVNELAILRNVTEALNQATSLRSAVLPVLETVKNVTNSKSVWILFQGKTSNTYQRIEYHPLSETNMLVIENVRSKSPRCLTNLFEGMLESPQSIKECPCSTLTSERQHRVFPLYIGKQPLGVLNFVEEPNTPFNENVDRLLQIICGSLAVAVERVRLFKSEYDQRKLAETFRDIGTALTTSLDLNEVLDLLLDQLSRVVPYDGGSVMLVGDGFARIARTRGYELSNKKNLAMLINQCLEIEKTANLKKIITFKKPVIIEDTHLDKLFLPSPVSADYHGWLGVPVINKGKVELIFSLDKVEAGFYTDEHAGLISAFSTQASLAINNASLFSAETERIKQLDALRATLTDISAQLDVKVLLQEVLKRAVSLLNTEIGELGLFEPQNDLLRILVSENLTPATVGMQIRRGEGAMGRIIETKQPITITDYKDWTSRMPEYEKYAMYSGLVVPMLGGNGELLGVIGVGNIKNERRFNENDIRLLNLFAQQATVALRNARLFEEAKRRAEEAETIRKAGAVVVSTLNQENAISLILEQLAQVVPYDSASVLLYIKGVLRIVGGHGFKDVHPVLGAEISLDRVNPGARVFLDNTPQIIANIPQEVPDFNQFSKNNHIIHSWLGVPLKIQNQPIGILSLDGHSVDQFTEEHKRLVTAFADQVAIALENSRLYESALQSASRFETLYKLSQVISTNIRTEEIYPAIHEATSELMETEFFSISLVDEKEGLIQDVYMVDRGEPVPLSCRPLGQGLFGRVLQNGKSILFNTFDDNMIEETGAVLIGETEEEGVSQSVLVVPLKIGTRMVGVLSAQSYQPYAYTDTDVELLELLGANAAIAIENARLFSEVQELAVTDPLTGLYNRRNLIELGEAEFKRSLRYERELSAIMLDCDHFKNVNDTHGHTVGDQILRELAEICLADIRQADILARYGGDEFMILLPETGTSATVQVAERLCRDVNNTVFETNAGLLSFSISVGVASLNKTCKTLGDLLDRADFASYVSKDSGGNRVTKWSQSLARNHEQSRKTD